MKHLLLITILFVFVIVCVAYPYYRQYLDRFSLKTSVLREEGMTSSELDEYVQSFKEKENRMFPFRYFTDENDKVLPFVAVTGFFREKKAEDRYEEYVKKGINVFARSRR